MCAQFPNTNDNDTAMETDFEIEQRITNTDARLTPKGVLSRILFSYISCLFCCVNEECMF